MDLLRLAGTAPVRYAVRFAAFCSVVMGALLAVIYWWMSAVLERHLDEGIEALHERLSNEKRGVSELRVTFYGMKEFDLRDPAGYTAKQQQAALHPGVDERRAVRVGRQVRALFIDVGNLVVAIVIEIGQHRIDRRRRRIEVRVGHDLKSAVIPLHVDLVERRRKPRAGHAESDRSRDQSTWSIHSARRGPIREDVGARVYSLATSQGD